MNAELTHFTARLGRFTSWPEEGQRFDELALELFALQFKYNPAYKKICERRGLTPENVHGWTGIPFVPTAAFKEVELSCIPPEERTAVFHSSGTTEQKPSRHFHCAESLEVYEASLWKWFGDNVIDSREFELVILTPPPASVPHSSLVHMFETVRRKLGAPESVFVGKMSADATWILDFDSAIASLEGEKPKLILGTAFSYVHLLDYLSEKDLRFELPPGSRVMETGGYKNRSRAMPKSELHSLIAEWLGIAREDIVCEYGMSELSSQAYDVRGGLLRFPPWARVQIVSPETGREITEGESGLIRIFDLANVFSVAAIQTEDLGIRRGDGFELVGRAAAVEPRGCSLMTA
jgi:Acyl-protein synthetase, LuxE